MFNTWQECERRRERAYGNNGMNPELLQHHVAPERPQSYAVHGRPSIQQSTEILLEILERDLSVRLVIVSVYWFTMT